MLLKCDDGCMHVYIHMRTIHIYTHMHTYVYIYLKSPFTDIYFGIYYMI
jgi:hypothetical protein